MAEMAVGIGPNFVEAQLLVGVIAHLSEVEGQIDEAGLARRRAPLRWADDGAASARSAPRPHEIENGEIEADEHHERDKPLITLGRTVRDDDHAAVVDVRRASPEEVANF
jgi:hypothetical protein